MEEAERNREILSGTGRGFDTLEVALIVDRKSHSETFR